MQNNEWLLERVDESQVDWFHSPVGFMLSQSSRNPPTDGEYFYEVKWDGIRAMIVLNEGEITIWSRNHNDITSKFPELQIPEDAFRAYSGVFDGEIVCLDPKGKPNFKNVINRLQQTTDGGIKKILFAIKPFTAKMTELLHRQLPDCILPKTS